MHSSRELPVPAGVTLSDEFTPPEASESVLTYLREAPTHRRIPRLHTRRHIPIVPQGAPTLGEAPAESLAIPAPLALAPMRGESPDDLVIYRLTELGSAADNGTASQVCEPSAAANEDVVFYTGNWFAAVSTDGGETFRYIDPATAFPEPPDMRFCCDQIVQYVPQIDMFVWLLQYMVDDTGKNVQRLAFATTEGVRQGAWWTLDVTSGLMGLPDLFLDFPDLSFGRNMLYMTTNGFSRSDSIFNEFEWACSIVLRIPLLGIQRGDVTGHTVMTDKSFNLRMAQYCGTIAYWATHLNTSTLRVFTWQEDEEQAVFYDVPVATWTGGNGFVSETPDGFNWLRRVDPRVLGAAKSGTILYFAWSADRGGANNRPHPYIQIARINTLNMKLLSNMNIWDERAAVAYPALSTNAVREVACGYCIGGGNRYPSHAISMLTRTRKDIIVAQGMRGPSQERWGDFLTMRRHYPHTRLFVSTGYVLKAGSGELDSTANYTVFGRRNEVEKVRSTEEIVDERPPGFRRR